MHEVFGPEHAAAAGGLPRTPLRAVGSQQAHPTLVVQVDTAAVPLHVTPLHVSVGHDAEELRVVWPENPPHVSVYPAKWLSDNAYWSSKNEGVAGARDPAMCKRSRVVFEADSFRRPDGSLALPHFDHDDVMASDHALYGALKAVSVPGAVRGPVRAWAPPVRAGQVTVCRATRPRRSGTSAS